MAKKKSLSDIEIAAKIRDGKSFRLGSNKERKKALSAAKFAGKIIKTEEAEDGFFDIYFCNP